MKTSSIRATTHATKAWDAQLDRAGDIVSGRFERLGKNYGRSQSAGGCSSDRVTVTGADAFADQKTGRISIDVNATATGANLSAAKAKQIAQDILRPLLEDARDTMKAEMKRSFDFDISLNLTRTQRFEIQSGFDR